MESQLQRQTGKHAQELQQQATQITQLESQLQRQTGKHAQELQQLTAQHDQLYSSQLREIQALTEQLYGTPVYNVENGVWQLEMASGRLTEPAPKRMKREIKAAQETRNNLQHRLLEVP